MTFTLITWQSHWSHDSHTDHMTVTLITWQSHWSHDSHTDHITVTLLPSCGRSWAQWKACFFLATLSSLCTTGTVCFRTEKGEGGLVQLFIQVKGERVSFANNLKSEIFFFFFHWHFGCSCHTKVKKVRDKVSLVTHGYKYWSCPWRQYHQTACQFQVG